MERYILEGLFEQFFLFSLYVCMSVYSAGMRYGAD